MNAGTLPRMKSRLAYCSDLMLIHSVSILYEALVVDGGAVDVT